MNAMTADADRLRFDVVTLFAAMFDAITVHGVSGRALARRLWQLQCWNPRDFATDAYRTIDDRPYGGGPGMVMMAEPLRDAIAAARAGRQQQGLAPAPVICLSPQGRSVDHAMIAGLVASGGATLLCGRYEGIDQRLLDRHVDEEWSLGDFVVSGGELPAMMIIDAVVRLLPGALNDSQSAQQDSFVDGLLDCPHYTRPVVFEDAEVPAVLLSGHHAQIAAWRRAQSLRVTSRRRPDLIRRLRDRQVLSRKDLQILDDLAAEDSET
ncbi:MAG: tRNA (guanosine(37)-N1)-methyltransferase TrmD [Burkholderiaceae bacterium]